MTKALYSDEQLRNAMLRAIHAFSPVRQRPRGLEFRAWWRGGDDWSCIFFPSTGAWSDVVDPPHRGNVTALAERMGLTFKTFMQMYGDGAPEPVQYPTARPQGRSRLRLSPDELEASWARLRGAEALALDPGFRHRQLVARDWLVHRRGFPVDQLKWLRGHVAGTDTTTLSHWPSKLRAWIGRLMEKGGPALCSPLRSAEDGQIHSFSLRFYEPPDGLAKVMCCPLPLTAGGDGFTPLGYGMAGESLLRPLVVVTEGLMDTFVSLALLRNTSVANVGSINAGELHKRWAGWLIRRKSTMPEGKVVVVYHLDAPRIGADGHTYEPGPDAAVNMVRHLRDEGVSANLFDWGVFAGHLEAAGCGTKDTSALGDLADGMKLCAMRGIAWERLQRAFLAGCQEDEL